MADSSRFTILCPCCEATLTIDAQTGAMISHEEKAKPVALAYVEIHIVHGEHRAEPLRQPSGDDHRGITDPASTPAAACCRTAGMTGPDRKSVV